MDLGPRDKTALELACSQGLGLGIATALCQEGAATAITPRGEEVLLAASAS